MTVSLKRSRINNKCSDPDAEHGRFGEFGKHTARFNHPGAPVLVMILNPCSRNNPLIFGLPAKCAGGKMPFALT